MKGLIISALTVGEKFGLGGQTALIGISIVFFMLVVLVGCIYLMDYFVKTIKGKKNQANSAVAPVPTIVENEVNLQDDSETVAAIMAALNMFYEGQNVVANTAKAKFIVKSIKRV